MSAEQTEQQQLQKDLRLCETLFTGAQLNRAHWEKIARLVMPEILEGADLETQGHRDKKERICGHAQMDVLKLASALATFITPMGQKWFQYAPWYDEDIDNEQWADESSWYSKATEIAHAELNKSNFYTELYATNIDLCLTGTGLLLGEGDTDIPLTFTHVPAGTFGIAESNNHEVNAVVRKMKMTPAQLVQEFGEEAVSDDTGKQYEDEGSRYNTSNAHTVYHLVEPNRDGVTASSNLEAEKRPWRSVYIDVNTKRYLRRGGYYEFPYFAPRFNRYGATPYGRAPLAGVIDDIRDLISLKYFNFINAQKKTMPPVLVSAEIEGEVDMRAGGQTIVSMSDAQAGLPREWATAGDIRDALQQIADYQNNIDNATYVNIIQAVTAQAKQMTATEVNAIEAEKVLTFSPSFMQYVTDYRPMNDRTFCILVRQGKMPMDDAPDSIKKEFPAMENEMLRERILPPNISYIGKMAQTIQQVQQQGLNATISELVTLAKETNDPEWLMPLNIENIVRWKLDASSVPWRCTYTPDKVKAKRQEMQTAQEQAQAAALAEQQSVAQRNMAAAAAART